MELVDNIFQVKSTVVVFFVIFSLQIETILIYYTSVSNSGFCVN